MALVVGNMFVLAEEVDGWLDIEAVESERGTPSDLEGHSVLRSEDRFCSNAPSTIFRRSFSLSMLESERRQDK